MDNLQLRQRIVRSMIRVSERTANMRKPEKFEYRKHMTAAFMDMLELCIEANRARGSRRVELQNKMDTKLDVLRSLVDTAVSPEDRLISPGLHEIWSKELNEIGRMLGGWKKSNEYMWWNNGVAERCVYRGGNWNNGANAGVFYLNGNNSRSNVNTNIGFRAALALFVYFLRTKAQQKHQGKRDAFPGRQGQRYTLVLLCRWRPPGTPSKPRRLAVVCYAGRRGIRILRRGDRRGKISPRNVTTRAIIMTTQGGTRTWIQETSPPFWREYTRGRIFWTHTTRQQARSGTATT